jgi:hypothetical protein
VAFWRVETMWFRQPIFKANILGHLNKFGELPHGSLLAHCFNILRGWSFLRASKTLKSAKGAI